MKEVIFFTLKSILKYLVSIKIEKNWLNFLKILSANMHGGGGGPAKLVKSQLF